MDLDTDYIDMELSLGAVIVAGILTLTVAVLVTAYRLGLLHQLVYKVEPNSTKHGGEIIANILKVHNVKFIFTLVGGHISPILVACEKIGIRVIDTRHEVSAVFAADAVARLTGGIGVAIVTAGPGVTNTVTAVKNAQMAESPVLLIGGAASTLLKCRGALQDIDQLSLFKTLCKFTTSVKTVRDIAPVLRQAINIALSGTPGPVFVEFPIDVLYPYYIVNKHITVKSGSGIVSKVLNWYLQIYIRNLFVGAWHPTDVTPIKVIFPEATSSEVQQCVELVSRATRPVIVLGSQVMLPPTSAQSLREALEYLGFPCFLGGMARGMLGKDNSIHIRNSRADVLKQADLVILAGTVCDFRLSYGRVLSRHSDIIAVNRDRSQLLKNSDMFWKPKIAIQGDAGSFLVKLADCLTGHKSPHEWTESLKEKDRAIDKMNSEKRTDKMEKHLNPLHVLYCTDNALVENSIIVADGGDFVGSCARIVQTHGPLQWLDPGAFGTLGVGGGFALGAKLCRPESEVWIIYGDGSVGYSIAEFDTFKRHKTPVIALVGNDACWSQISREQVPMLGSSVACNLSYTDYHKVAEGYGAKGFFLNTDNGKFTDDLLIEAKLIARTGVPTLINALIGKSDFREGSISV